MNLFSKLFTAATEDNLEGRRLRYLIGSAQGDIIYRKNVLDIVEVGFDSACPSGGGTYIAYCNLFDEYNSGDYAPYLFTSDTAVTYTEGQIDPAGPGWDDNLHEQFKRRKRQGFEYIELDNPDAYNSKDVLRAYDLAASYGFKIIAKNPEICDDPEALLRHPSVVGAIVERDCGTPEEMQRLRGRANKGDSFPVWFVCFGSKGKTWGNKTANSAKQYLNMYVSHSSKGEYENSEDL